MQWVLKTNWVTVKWKDCSSSLDEGEILANVRYYLEAVFSVCGDLLLGQTKIRRVPLGEVNVPEGSHVLISNNRHAFKPSTLAEMRQRRDALVGHVFTYHLFNLNCEHFATFVRYGKAVCNQVWIWHLQTFQTCFKTNWLAIVIFFFFFIQTRILVIRPIVSISLYDLTKRNSDIFRFLNANWWLDYVSMYKLMILLEVVWNRLHLLGPCWLLRQKMLFVLSSNRFLWEWRI